MTSTIAWPPTDDTFYLWKCKSPDCPPGEDDGCIGDECSEFCNHECCRYAKFDLSL